MRPRSWDTDRLGRLDAALTRHVDEGAVTGMTWLVARGGDVHTGAAGAFGDATASDEPGSGRSSTPVDRSTIYRISSRSLHKRSRRVTPTILKRASAASMASTVGVRYAGFLFAL